jgi:hypothetical protein
LRTAIGKNSQISGKRQWIRPVKAKWHMEEGARKTLARRAMGLRIGTASGIGRGGLDAKAALAWAAVGIPLCWGISKTLEPRRKSSSMMAPHQDRAMSSTVKP